MKTVNIYVCEVCKKESRVAESMQKHEEKCKKEAALKKLRQQTYKKELKHLCQELDLNNIQEVVNAYVDKMFGDHFDEISIDVHFCENASNSHCAPTGGVVNWHGIPELPSGYPAYIGRIKGTYSKKDKSISDYSRDSFETYSIPIHTGSGGGAGKRWGYGVTLFIADFDKLAVEAAKMYLQEV